jgi:hypothetical protein
MSFPPAMCLPKSRIGKLLYWLEQQLLVPVIAFLLFGGVALVAFCYLLSIVFASVWGVIILFS